MNSLTPAVYKNGVISDQDDAIFEPTSVSASVINSAGTTVVVEGAAYVVSNTASFLINTAVTATAGEYNVIWKVLKTISGTTYTYYHKTQLIVEEL